MRLIYRGQISPQQDGAIWGELLFRFDARGNCRVHSLAREGFPEVGAFALDRRETLCPHSNAVFFGVHYARPGDEFPLLYSNVYNTYSRQPDRREGMCCVYRLFREEGVFRTALAQVLKVGFREQEALWGIGDNVRPYGNFTLDREKGVLYAFTMRDREQTTRYFALPLPDPREGTVDPALGVPVRTLEAEEILFRFDTPYHRYVQGACCHRGLVYSLEGFTDNRENPPALRIIDPEGRCQRDKVLFETLGTTVEPECIDFQGELCWYSDCRGNLYNLIFEEGDHG